MTAATYEVHEHVFIGGPRANGVFDASRQKTTSHFEHSHADGAAAHSHPDAGPACFTIDKDEWFMATGLKGGGRKKFTKKPSGDQLDYIEPTQSELTFRVVVTSAYTGEHVRAGIDRDEHEAFVARAREAASGAVVPSTRRGQPGHGGAAVANMALSFNLEPMYEVDP